MSRSHSIPLALTLVLAACGDDDGSAVEDTTSTGSPESDTGSTPTTTPLDESSTANDETSSSSSDTGVDASSSEGTTGEPGTPQIDVLVELDAELFELPEGLFIDGTDAIVGFAFTGAVERIALADGTRTPFAATPPPPPNTSFVTGVTVDADGRLYAAVVSFTPDLTAGIYRAEADGGAAALWATDPGMVFPNGLAWDDEGNLFVSDSSAGISRIDADGVVTPWFEDEQLAGDPTACDQQAMFTIGPNGIAWTPDTLWIASSDRGVLARVAIEADGDAGALELVVGPECELGGIDGITIDVDGSIVAAVNRQDKIVRIDGTGAITTIVEGDPLAFPASVAFADDGALVVTSFALDDFLAGQPASPAILRVHWDE
jgi:sugar lactone lactonase YvrE